MALFIRQDEKRSQLQERLAAELQERSRQRAHTTLPDGVNDSKYLQGTKTTTRLAWVWALLALLVIIAIVWLVILSTQSSL